jgi:hypothetical protein
MPGTSFCGVPSTSPHFVIIVRDDFRCFLLCGSDWTDVNREPHPPEIKYQTLSPSGDTMVHALNHRIRNPVLLVAQLYPTLSDAH